MESIDDHPIITVSFGDEKHHVRLRSDKNARRLTLRVRPAKRDVLLSIPTRVSRARAVEFVELHSAWIREKLGKLPPLIELAPGALIPIRGDYHRIIHAQEIRGTAWIDNSADSEGPALFVAGHPEHSRRRIKNFLIQLARSDLTASVAHYCQELGKEPPRITLRDTSSRWGSCSNKGELSFSWRLILAPPIVLDYLCAHEVTHLLELNHSKKFWKTVTSICGHVEDAERWLQAHGSTLHAYK